ncbi:hypothetical protein EJ110_NYTH49000 [Nymphaea thermarum]|nr:hypothetical protein EJ110_NYTH49000 [Nymphaea thermarum]
MKNKVMVARILVLSFLAPNASTLYVINCAVLAAPVYQMKQYYRYGVFDNCSDKWNALFDCFHLKTKRSSEVQEILESREKSKPHIWSYRTPEEASVHWKELFGNVNDP